MTTPPATSQTRPIIKEKYTKPVQVSPTYTDLYLINNNNNNSNNNNSSSNNYYIYKSLTQFPIGFTNSNKTGLVKPPKADTRFMSKNKSNAFGSSNGLESLSSSFFVDSSFNFVDSSVSSKSNQLLPSNNFMRKSASTANVAANTQNLLNLANNKQYFVEDESLLDDDTTKSISINGKSYKLPDTLDKKTLAEKVSKKADHLIFWQI